MTVSFQQLLAMVGRSIQSPREGAAEVLALGIPREAVWLCIAIAAVLSTCLNQIGIYVIIQTEPEFSFLLESNLLVTAIGQVFFQLVRIAAIYRIGHLAGGTGNLIETAIVMSWLQFVLTCAQAVLFLLLLIIPLLGALGFIVFAVVAIRMLVVFVMTLHGFRSVGQGVMTVLLAYGAVFFLFLIVVSLLGGGGEPPTGAT